MAAFCRIFASESLGPPRRLRLPGRGHFLQVLVFRGKYRSRARSKRPDLNAYFVRGSDSGKTIRCGRPSKKESHKSAFDPIEVLQ